MIEIDRLRLHLPAGFERRAAGISRMVAEELARLPLAGEKRLETLRVPGVQASPGQSNRQVAARIASAIASNLHSQNPSTQTKGNPC